VGAGAARGSRRALSSPSPPSSAAPRFLLPLPLPLPGPGPDPRALSTVVASPFAAAAGTGGDPWRPDAGEEEALLLSSSSGRRGEPSAAAGRSPSSRRRGPHPPSPDPDDSERVVEIVVGGSSIHSADIRRVRAPAHEAAAEAEAEATGGMGGRPQGGDPFFPSLEYSTPRPPTEAPGTPPPHPPASLSAAAAHTPPPTALEEALGAGDDERVLHLLSFLEPDVAEDDVRYAERVGARDDIVRALRDRVMARPSPPFASDAAAAAAAAVAAVVVPPPG
jgi:hypothetical protein